LEQVLVFETNGPVKDLFDAVKETPGLAWLVDEELTELDPDADFRDAKNAEKKLSARLYMVMTNEVALSQLLGVWNAWKAGGRGKKASAALKLWRPLFGCLRDIRRWEAQDRIEETGIREQWTVDIAIGASSVPVELDLWFRTDAETRSVAEGRVRKLVEEAGGRILSTANIPAIAHHALLADIPRIEAEKILSTSPDLALVLADDLRFFRPTPQVFAPGIVGETEDISSAMPPPGDLGAPVVALLDGLPIENHVSLRGRLTVDDPDDFGTTYGLGDRRHGTGMASLILHGDLSAPGPPLGRRLYVRPILRPRVEFADRREMVPRDHATIEMTMRYAHLSPDVPRQAVKLLDGLGSSVEPWRQAGDNARVGT